MAFIGQSLLNQVRLGLLPHLGEMVWEWVGSAEFREMLRQTVQTTYPEHEWGRFEAHFQGLIDVWLRDEAAKVGA